MTRPMTPLMRDQATAIADTARAVLTPDAPAVEPLGVVADVLAAHATSGVSGVTEGTGEDEHYVGAHSWCYCGADETKWRGTFNMPKEQAAAELRAHVAAAVLDALGTGAGQADVGPACGGNHPGGCSVPDHTGVCEITYPPDAADKTTGAGQAAVEVGFRYQDGDVLSPDREAQSGDVELPVVVLDLGDGEWLTLAELRDMHSERLEQSLAASRSAPPSPSADDGDRDSGGETVGAG